LADSRSSIVFKGIKFSIILQGKDSLILQTFKKYYFAKVFGPFRSNNDLKRILSKILRIFANTNTCTLYKLEGSLCKIIKKIRYFKYP